jgi:murein DD-endopeptidase MepM/ murein hydrolase activator NlpD
MSLSQAIDSEKADDVGCPDASGYAAGEDAFETPPNGTGGPRQSPALITRRAAVRLAAVVVAAAVILAAAPAEAARRPSRRSRATPRMIVDPSTGFARPAPRAQERREPRRPRRSQATRRTRTTPRMIVNPSTGFARPARRPRRPRPVYPLARRGKLNGRPYQGTHRVGNWQSDNAIDLNVRPGTRVYAVRSGVIGSRIGPLNSNKPRLAGHRLTLRTRVNDYYYAHLSKLNKVKAGQRVKRGQLLGLSGSANRVAHLHIGTKKGNPLRILKWPLKRVLWRR